MKEIARVLKSGGVFVVSVYDIMDSGTFDSFKEVSEGYNNVDILFDNKPHQIQYITREIMEQFCAELGLYREYDTYTGHVIYVLKKF
jgi:hypothetical protein